MSSFTQATSNLFLHYVSRFSMGGGLWFAKLILTNTKPIPSMDGIFTCIWLIFMVNVGKYTIHGWYGKGFGTYLPSLKLT